MKGITGLSTKLMPIFKSIVSELASLSWIAMVSMMGISGALWLFGNEFGAKKTFGNAVKGFIIIQIASMLL